jgi:hypothetical protein
MASAAEAEMGALFYNAKDGAMLRVILEELGHPQGATPLQTDNSCASGIANDTVKQRRSKAIDMRFYWIKDRVRKGEFLVFWRAGSENDADYFTKHHSPSHHRLMRSRYLFEKLTRHNIRLQRGCVDVAEPAGPKMPAAPTPSLTLPTDSAPAEPSSEHSP